MPANTDLVTALRQNLDAGEAEAIALAVETNADFLIIDERLGRRVAERFNLNMVGVVGILVLARKRNLITAIRPVIDQLRDQAGFRLSDVLVQRVLADQDE